MANWIALGIFILICFGAAATAAIAKPDAWYRELDKPRWTPKDWVFPTVWTPLYLMIAVAGWLIWRVDGFGLALALWAAQLAFNAAWSPIFFTLRRPDWALIESAVLWLSIFVCIVVFAGISPVAAWLFAPYLLWVTIATVLTASIWRKWRRPIASI